MIRLLALTLSLVACAASAAQPKYQRPGGVAAIDEPLITAGYRALFTCSAHFFAGRPLDDIEKIELIDTEGKGYPHPLIDEQRRLVSAADTSGKITMTAVFRDAMGCTVLPPEWKLTDIPRLPYVPYAPPPDVSNVAFPAGDKVELPPDGIDAKYRVLAPIVERAFDAKSYGDATVTAAVIVVKGGKIIAERYRSGFGVHSGYRTWSTSKSITAAVLSIAHEKGVLDLNGKADIPEWSYPGDMRQAITYKQLLWMSSGLFSGGDNTYSVYFGGQDVVSAATTTQLEVEPGTRWKYANNDTLLAMRALRHKLGDDLKYLRYPYDELLHPLGMYHTRMEIDHLGNFVASSQTYTTARDLTRFGMLLQAGGVWNGKQLVSKEWIKLFATPAPTRAPTKDQWGYGAQFWLFDQMAGVPAGTYSTAGNKGQFVTVVPGQDLLIVRTGVDPLGKRWVADRFVADVVDALAK